MIISNNSKIVLSILVVLLTGNATCTVPSVGNEWKCTWSGYNEATLKASQKMAFFNERVSTLMNPLAYRFEFTGIAQCGYLDIEHYNGEFRPLMFQGKFIKKDGTFVTSMEGIDEDELVYTSY